MNNKTSRQFTVGTIVVVWCAAMLVACSGQIPPMPTTFPRLTDTSRPTTALAPTSMSTTENITFTPTPLLVEVPTATSTQAPRQALPSPRKKSDIYTGTYTTGESENGSGCTLTVLQQYADEIEFELSCNRGAPSFNSGQAKDSLPLEGNKAVYSVSYLRGKECEIKFEFQDASVNVTQLGDSPECGFGLGVYAGGTYHLTDKTHPVPGCMPARCTPTPKK